jgi:hypothetical protein
MRYGVGLFLYLATVGLVGGLFVGIGMLVAGGGSGLVGAMLGGLAIVVGAFGVLAGLLGILFKVVADGVTKGLEGASV